MHRMSVTSCFCCARPEDGSQGCYGTLMEGTLTQQMLAIYMFVHNPNDPEGRCKKEGREERGDDKEEVGSDIIIDQ